jgi:glycosyltransferase involved in cell wall biosynthesis
VFKVLQLCNKAPFPANDGSSIAIYNMAKGLIDNNVELHLLTINTKKHFKPDENVPEDFREKAHYRSVFKNTNTSVAGALANLLSSESYFVDRFYFPAFEARLVELLKQNTFDIIQLEGLFMGVYLAAIKKHSSARVVLRAHNIEHFIWDRHILNEKNRLKKLYLRIQNRRLKQFELKVMSEVDAIVPITRVDEAAFRSLGFSKPMFSCITGVDVNYYQLRQNTPVKPKTVFYFGSMDWLPNQEAVMWFLDHCWPHVHKTVPEAKFIIAGRGMPHELLHLSKPNVLVIENVSDGKAFFHQHEVMVVPLLSGSGLRIKIIEGMAYGKAIVSTTVGAEGINYSNQENILIADTPSDFATAVIELLRNDSRRMAIENGASALAHREFDNLGVVAGLVGFYKNLLHA